MEIGAKIKQLRVLNGLTQEELADRTELSKGFISQLERDLASPSISTLEDILTVLGIEISQFFSDNGDEQVVFTEDEFFEKTDDQLKNKIEWVIPNAQKNHMEPIRLTLEPGGKTLVDNPHEGEEFGYVIEGEITLAIGSNRHSAVAGEAFYYKADREHYISSEKGAVIVWVSSPPSF